MSSFPPGLKRSAAMVVLRCNDQFLLLKRSRPPHQGKYLPVGGKLDPFEDPYSAAVRETYEETGLNLHHIAFAGVLVETSPVDYNWQSFIYLADIPFLPPPPCEEGRLEWIPSRKLRDIPTPETDWHVYQYLMKGKHFAFNAIYNDRLEMLQMREEMEGIVVFRKDEIQTASQNLDSI